MFTKLFSGALLAVALPGTCDMGSGLYLPVVQESSSSFTSASDLGFDFARSEQLFRQHEPPEGPGGVDPPHK